jgi:hypothetical protein
VAICLFIVLIMRLPRHYEERGTNDVVICLLLVLIMRLLRSYFPRNDGGLRHCEKARRGNLFVISFNHEITSVILSS